MKPGTLYKTLGMDKKIYSDAPKVEYVKSIQPEHYYVHIDGWEQQNSMLNILDLPSVRYSDGVYNLVKTQKNSIIRVNIEERLNDKTKMKVSASSKAIAKANDSETISVLDFLREIT